MHFFLLRVNTGNISATTFESNSLQAQLNQSKVCAGFPFSPVTKTKDCSCRQRLCQTMSGSESAPTLWFRGHSDARQAQ